MDKDFDQQSLRKSHLLTLSKQDDKIYWELIAWIAHGLPNQITLRKMSACNRILPLQEIKQCGCLRSMALLLL